MISTPEGFTNNITISTMKSTPVKKPSSWKSLCMFTNFLDVNKMTSYSRVGAAKSKARQLNMEIHHGHWNKSEKGTQKSVKRWGSLFITGLYIVHKLCKHQLQIVVWRWKLKVTLNHNFFQKLFLLQVSVRELHKKTCYRHQRWWTKRSKRRRW